MTAAIATQIRARLDAIPAERAGLDDEERRLKKALCALEPTTPVEAPGLDEAIQRQIVPMTPGLPTYPMPYPVPHHPPPSWDRWVIPDGPQIDIGPDRIVRVIGTTLPVCGVDGVTFLQPTTVCAATCGDSQFSYGHNQD